MAGIEQKSINIGLAAALIVVVILLFVVSQVTAGKVDARLAEYSGKVAELDATTRLLAAQNDELLAYLDEYHGDDKQRSDDLAKMKILLEDHRAKIDRLFQTIRELH